MSVEDSAEVNLRSQMKLQLVKPEIGIAELLSHHFSYLAPDLTP
jgi:hypothetical protein